MKILPAFLCAMVSVGFVSASDAIGASTSKNLQSLVNEASAEIDLAYRQHAPERELRQQQLAEVLKAWRDAEHSQANNKQLANWLHAAIATSMPGSQEALPAVPTFAS